MAEVAPDTMAAEQQAEQQAEQAEQAEQQAEQPQHEHIVFALEPQDQEQLSALDAERELHRTRAERFGTQYRDPAALPRFAEDARRERFRREGFATGIDLFSAEEQAKRAARAAKFGLPPEGSAPAASYGPDPEEARRAARAKKFGVAYNKPTPEALAAKADLFEPAKQAPSDMPRREEAIYLYGVDVMSSADCLAYFEDYGPSLVEWINDSSCCVVFEDAASARRAIAGCGHPLSAEEASSAPDSMDETMTEAGVDPAASIPYLWHKGRDFIKGKDARGRDIKVSLMYRMATELDQKDPHAEKRSRYLWKPQGKRRYDDYHAGQEQQQQRRRGGRQQQQQQHWDDGGGGDGGDGGDVDMQQAGGRRVRRRQRGRRGAAGEGGGDQQMLDAEGEDGAAAAGGDDGGGGAAQPDLSHGLKLRVIAARHARKEAEEAPWDEVPQPDEDGDGC